MHNDLDKIFVVKPNSIGPPTQYIGKKVSYVTLDNGRNAWSFRSSQYVQDSVKNVIDTLSQEGKTLSKHAKSPWDSNYRPKTDTLPEFPAPRSAYYQYLIGILLWINELGRVDITIETSAMASMMAMPIEGHLEQLFHMFTYLRIKHNSLMVFDTTDHDIDGYQFFVRIGRLVTTVNTRKNYPPMLHNQKKLDLLWDSLLIMIMPVN